MPIWKAVIALVSIAMVVVLIFYRVSLNVHFQLPRDVQAPDDEQEARYHGCTANRDTQIHKQAFDTIDNPDVQREFITLHRERARQECRTRYPERTQTVRQGFCFNLLDFEPRFGLHYEHRSGNTDTQERRTECEGRVI